MVCTMIPGSIDCSEYASAGSDLYEDPMPEKVSSTFSVEALDFSSP